MPFIVENGELVEAQITIKNEKEKMSKILNCFEKYQKLKRPIQLAIYLVLAIAIVGTVIGIILGTKSCKSNDTLETVEAKYFMGETIVVHENFDIKVHYAKTVESISYVRNKGDNELTTLQGNYIEVNLDVTKQVDSNEKNHKLDIDDFKLRNHSGVYLPLNDIMSLFDINAVDVHIDTDDNGFVKSSADFSNKKALKDYSWFGTELKNGETINITLFFEMKEGYKVEKDLMLLEVDFYTGRNGNKKGEDIVLLNCKRK